ncbi:MAG: SoxR reducing system RseC family protein [Deltaproteobacteria bacterium]|nr:SoxR reducing system RseC family protein [Deltaproteobacteria bacterium]
MLHEEGIVRSVHGDNAVVSTHRGTACESCGAHGACNAMGGGREMVVEALNEAQASVGDRVEISIEETSVLKASVFVYLIPVVMLLIGAAIGKILGARLEKDTDIAAFLFGIVAFAVSLVIVRQGGRKLGRQSKYVPIITRILAKEQASNTATG